MALHMSCTYHNRLMYDCKQGFCAGSSSVALTVSRAVQDTARLHQAAKLAAAVPLPPAPPAANLNMAGTVGRASVADLFTATPPVFGATPLGMPSLNAAVP